ncbi:MAG: HAD family hydrolase, partial [Kiritimatiellaceae bacterium]|nr:HAD family hydrolase [Kiritimatiellaceae bacterium]
VLFSAYGTLLISQSDEQKTTAEADCVEALIQSLIVSGFDGDCERAGELGPALLRAELERWHKSAHKDGIDFPEVDMFRVWMHITETLSRLELLRADHDVQKVRRLAVEYACRVNPVWPMPGALELLEKLRKRGFRLGIVANGQFYTALQIEALFGQSLEALGFDPELCVWSYRTLHAKPSPTLFHGLEKEIQFNQTLYVGNDVVNDLLPAGMVGCSTVLFAGDQHSLNLRENDERRRNFHPHAVIDELRQLLNMI